MARYARSGSSTGPDQTSDGAAPVPHRDRNAGDRWTRPPTSLWPRGLARASAMMNVKLRDVAEEVVTSSIERYGIGG